MSTHQKITLPNEIPADERYVSMGCSKAPDERHHFIQDGSCGKEAVCFYCRHYIVYLGGK